MQKKKASAHCVFPVGLCLPAKRLPNSDVVRNMLLQAHHDLPADVYVLWLSKFLASYHCELTKSIHIDKFLSDADEPIRTIWLFVIHHSRIAHRNVNDLVVADHGLILTVEGRGKPDITMASGALLVGIGHLSLVRVRVTNAACFCDALRECSLQTSGHFGLGDEVHAHFGLDGNAFGDANICGSLADHLMCDGGTKG